MRAAPTLRLSPRYRRMIPPHKEFWHSTTEEIARSSLLLAADRFAWIARATRAF